jgi:hypothetical protein
MSDYEWDTYEAKNYCETGSELFFAIAHWVVEKINAQAERVDARPSELTAYDQIISATQAKVNEAQTTFEAHVLTCSHCFAHHPNVPMFMPTQ